LLVSSVTKVSAAGRDLSIEATMLTLAGILVDGTLSVSADGKIASVGPTAPNQGVIAPIKVSGVVLPAFIDLHDHLTWNVQPRWLPSRKFSNRYEWQDAAKHDCVLSNPHYAAMNTVSCEAEIEIKALARGATSVLGGLLRSDTYPDNQAGAKSGYGLRFPTNRLRTADVRQLKIETDRRLLDVVDNEIFPLELTHDRFDYLLCALGNKTLRGLVVHLSEGASVDSAAHREYSMLSKEVLLGGKDGKKPVVREGLAIVHGQLCEMLTSPG
jgi:5-methylthioadenosine/S-adenosylhomocysteine deaminase